MSPTLLGFVVFLGCVLFAFIIDTIIGIEEAPSLESFDSIPIYPMKQDHLLYHPGGGFETLSIHVCDVPCSDYIPQLPLKENRMTHKPEVGKWYENRYSRMADKYVIGFKENGEVVLQDLSNHLTHCSLECFQDSYKKKLEIVRKYFNVYLFKDNPIVRTGTLHDTEEKAKAESQSLLLKYLGTYPVDIRLP